VKKVLVSLPEEIIEIIDKELIGKLGEGHSDTLRKIIMNWLSEQGYLKKSAKPKNHQSQEEHQHGDLPFYTS
jgi:hypothetical protein